MGRSKKRSLFGPPRDERWTWLPVALQASDVWRHRSITCVRLLEFLICEHSNHAGRENGNLCATYDQLELAGLTRSLIRSAVEEAVELGLLRVTSPGGRLAGAKVPSRYRLTFYPTRDGAPPTNEWKISDRRVAREIQRDQRAQKTARAHWRRSLKNQSGGSTTDTDRVR